MVFDVSVELKVVAVGKSSTPLLFKSRYTVQPASPASGPFLKPLPSSSRNTVPVIVPGTSKASVTEVALALPPSLALRPIPRRAKAAQSAEAQTSPILCREALVAAVLKSPNVNGLTDMSKLYG